MPRPVTCDNAPVTADCADNKPQSGSNDQIKPSQEPDGHSTYKPPRNRKTHMSSTSLDVANFETHNSYARMEAMILRHCPRLMRTGHYEPSERKKRVDAGGVKASKNEAIADRCKKIIDLRAQGVTVAEIAAIVGCHYNTVYNTLKKHKGTNNVRISTLV